MEFVQQWNEVLFEKSPDARLKEWPLMGNPLQLLVIIAAWLYFILRAGPRYMADRKAMSLKQLVQIINCAQILINMYLTYEFLAVGWLNGYKLRCQPCETSTNPEAMRMVKACYGYLLLKIFDLIDTIIYVFRRKTNQISFLHVYHHAGTLITVWMLVNYSPGGEPTLGMLLNTIVHVVMYIYYLFAAMGPKYQRYLWWKRYLTLFQMAQFTIQLLVLMDMMTQQLFTEKGCEFKPMILAYIGTPPLAVLFALFINFYIQSYKKKGKNKRE